MDRETLYKAIGDIDERIVEDARTPQKKSQKKTEEHMKKHMRKHAKLLRAAAACLCALLALGAWAWRSASLQRHASDTPWETADCPPHFVVDEKTYMISAHLAMSETLPEGFCYAGTADIDGVGKDAAYYTNADVPEWVYVRQQVYTTGETDASGTLIPAEAHESFVRYVLLSLRGKDLLCHDGTLYISMWSAESTDVDASVYRAINEAYGVRIEGDAPQGFVLLGTADFSGYDTVPRTQLCMNTDPAQVYFDARQPHVALVRTHWHTAPDAQGQTRHDGFTVYVQCARSWD